jgi:hypothetical protein
MEWSKTYQPTDGHARREGGPMPGLRGRLSGLFSGGEAAPPPFSLELPDGWAGGYGSDGWIDALIEYARAHPEDHDRAFELMKALEGVDGLFVACAVRGPYLDVVVSADDKEPGGGLSDDDQLDAWVEGNLEFLATDGDRVGDPIVSIVREPYPGREIRWNRSYDTELFATFDTYCFAAAGRFWTLEFSDHESAPSPETSFRTIALSFRVG